jgi:hypothetical protein
VTTIKETDFAPQWQTFNVLGAVISRTKAGQGEVPPNGVRSRDGLTCAAGICDLVRIG